MKLPVLLLFFALAFSACSDNNDPIEGEIIVTEELNFTIDTLATGLQNPWGMAFLPDGRILIAERPGRLRIFENGQLMEEPVTGLPQIWAHGQGGLLDVVLHPDYEQNQWIYLAYSAPGNPGGNTAISRARLDGNALTDLEELFMGYPSSTSGAHFGTRIVFDDNNYLFFTIGDRGNMETAQELFNHNGTIMRLHDDGSLPADNPFIDTTDAMPEIWSYGHRNIQGMQRHPQTGVLWATEHGPKGGDEINRIHKGGNYGWPLVTHGVNYDGSIITPDTTMEGKIDPILHWTPSIAPCGMSFVYSDKYPEWENNMLVTALANQHLHRVVFQDTTVVHTERILEGMARFRHVAHGPDGYLYVLTETPGLFFRMIPE